MRALDRARADYNTTFHARLASGPRQPLAEHRQPLVLIRDFTFVEAASHGIAIA